jgi:ABC-type dipeptide/oligopeptide/nickel transport system permease component
MLAFIARRLLQSVLVMLTVGFIAFSLFNFVGDPVALMLPPEATQADRDEVRKSLGLDKPFYTQFAVFVQTRCRVISASRFVWAAPSPNCLRNACLPRWSWWVLPRC